jgi:hypothetical protein
VKPDVDRKEVYILSAEVAELSYVASKVRDGKLIPGITSAGTVFVWAQTIPNSRDRMGYRVHAGLVRAGEEARKKWVSLKWEPALMTEEPREPFVEEPRWPNGQTLEEMFEIAIKGVFIDRPDHPVIRRLDTITKEV